MSKHIDTYKYMVPPTRTPSPFPSPCSQVSPAFLAFMSIRIFTIRLMLAGYVAKPVKTHPKIQKTKTNTHTQKKREKSEDYFTVTSHIVLRKFCFVFVVFVVFVFLFCFSAFFGFLVSLVVFGFLGFLFRQGCRCKAKIQAFSVIFGNVPKQSEISEIFGNRICRNPRRGLVRNQFESSSCYGLHTNVLNLTLTWQLALFHFCFSIIITVSKARNTTLQDS